VPIHSPHARSSAPGFGHAHSTLPIVSYVLAAEEAGGPLADRTRPEELIRVFPRRWAIPRDTWARFFSSAEQEIGILACSALFLAEDAGLLGILTGKARTGVSVRIALGDPGSPQVADRGTEEGIGAAMPTKVHNALALFRPLGSVPEVELRLHRAILYNSIYRADDHLLVNQHAYGMPAAHAPVFHIMRTPGGEMAEAHLTSLERVWATGRPYSGACRDGTGRPG
jgi:hypothetical protein